MTTQELTLVPPGRLAALLVDARRTADKDVVAMAAASGGRFDVHFLDKVEGGRMNLTDGEIENLVQLYGVTTQQSIIPARSELILDLDAGKIVVGETGISADIGLGRVDDVLERYLSLLYIMRGITPGTNLTLRDRDLVVLAEGLEREAQFLESRLGQLMGRQATRKRTSRLGGRFALPTVGLLVAVTAIGSLVIVGGGSHAGANSSPAIDGGATSGQVTGATAASTSVRGLILPAGVTSTADAAGVTTAGVTAAGAAQELLVPATANLEADQGAGAEEVAAPATDVAAVEAVGAVETVGAVEIAERVPFEVGAFTAAIANPEINTAESAAPQEPTPAPVNANPEINTAENAAPQEPTPAPVNANPEINTAENAPAHTQPVATETPNPEVRAAEQAPAHVPAPVTEITNPEVHVQQEAHAVDQAAAARAQLGAEAESLINFHWQSMLPGWNIEYQADTPGFRGATHTSAQTITIYINPGDTASSVAQILAHEIGHALDVVHLTDAERGEWIEARNMPWVWWANSAQADFEVGAGDFAEAFAQLTTGSPSASAYGNFTADQLQLVQRFLS